MIWTSVGKPADGLEVLSSSGWTITLQRVGFGMWRCDVYNAGQFFSRDAGGYEAVKAQAIDMVEKRQ